MKHDESSIHFTYLSNILIILTIIRSCNFTDIVIDLNATILSLMIEIELRDSVELEIDLDIVGNWRFTNNYQ